MSRVFGELTLASLLVVGMSGAWAEGGELGESEEQVWPVVQPEEGGASESVNPPAYHSADGVYEHPLPQNNLRYDSKQGTFIRPDSNTPSGFNPRDPARGYQVPEGRGVGRER